MTEEKKHTVNEHIDVILSEGESMSREDFADKIEDLYKQNMHKAYDSYSIELVRHKQVGWTLFFNGTREETKQETTKREAEEAAKRKQIEAAELKEYLRLKKKYGKKEEG